MAIVCEHDWEDGDTYHISAIRPFLLNTSLEDDEILPHEKDKGVNHDS